MADYLKIIKQNADMPLSDQKKAGQPIGDDMDDEHKNFLKTVIDLLDRKEIDTAKPESFFNKQVYDGLTQEWKDKVDLATVNIADQLRHIEDFYRDKSIPDASPQLQTMIEYLWQMKQRIEDHHDVYKF